MIALAALQNCLPLTTCQPTVEFRSLDSKPLKFSTQLDQSQLARPGLAPTSLVPVQPMQGYASSPQIFQRRPFDSVLFRVRAAENKRSLPSFYRLSSGFLRLGLDLHLMVIQ
jgi:hypothetical protein